LRYGFEQWNRSLARVIANARSADFPASIEAALKTLIDFDILMVFAYSGPAKPLCLYHNMTADRAATVISDYSKGPYLLDPFYNAAVNLRETGVNRLRDLAPDQFYSSEYFKRHYVRTRIRDEVGFFLRPRADMGVVVSITRPIEEPLFSATELRTIRAAEPVIRTLAESYWKDAGDREASGTERHPSDPINSALDQMARNLLTAREIEITSLILRGHSSASIAALLKIVEGTVKIHRKNIYQKLSVSSQSELFSLFISHLQKY
jgi:DNA-binding CsgD family transcriptional regulator